MTPIIVALHFFAGSRQFFASIVTTARSLCVLALI
jgi:hypothetical protein